MLSEPRASRHLKGNTVYRSRMPEPSPYVNSSTASKIGSNIYEQLYRSHHLKIGDDTTQEDAQQIIKHLGYLYNTVGTVVRDVTKVLACKFNAHGRSYINNRQKQNVNTKNFIWGQEQAMISDDDDYVDNQHKQPTNFRKEDIPSYVQDSQIMVEQHKQHFIANSSLQHNENQKQPQKLPQSSHISVGLPQYQQATSLNIHTQTVHQKIISPQQKPFTLSVPFVPQFSVYQLQYNNISRQSVNPHINNSNNNVQQNNSQGNNAQQISQSQQHTHNKHRTNIRQIHKQKQAEINAQQNNQPKFVQVIQIDDDD